METWAKIRPSMNISENIFVKRLRGNTIDINLGIIAYAISIKLSCTGTIALYEKNVQIIFIQPKVLRF